MLVTVAEAVVLLDPPIRRRTLERLLVAMDLQEAGRRVHRGRPARVYEPAALYRAHAEWVRRQVPPQR